ncbi:MAG: aspartate--ammonia ligase [Defluviitaleaceae bacterium]|nr:aspartate--ammonia ligase [Defluviitaleaceae bacterium]
MPKILIPPGYKSVLSLYDTQVAIGILKRTFETALSEALNLKRVSAPLFVDPNTGLNDDLNGIDRPVSFTIKETGKKAEIIQSLAKWKRMALYKYDFHIGKGLYTDMNAIRRDDEMDNLHSVYVDQWDWEKVIDAPSRNLEFLQKTVESIIEAICKTADTLQERYPILNLNLTRKTKFITTHELNNLYPNLSSKEQEDAITKEHKTVFLMQIERAPDYDDWQLNGDILIWSDILNCAVELSSMGIRVDPTTLDAQLKKANCEHRRNLEFHSLLLAGKLPLTIGGGIGQSRLSMMLLKKAHVGEVQVSLWDEETVRLCTAAGIELL